MDVFAKMVEVESDSVQTQLGVFQLGRNPARSIDVGNPFVGLSEFQPSPLTPQNRADLRPLRAAQHDVSMVIGFIVERDRLEFLERLVGTDPPGRQGA